MEQRRAGGARAPDVPFVPSTVPPARGIVFRVVFLVEMALNGQPGGGIQAHNGQGAPGVQKPQSARL